MVKKLNNNLIKLVQVLNDEAHHDGNTLGEALGMTRSAIWKTINKLKSYGIAIASEKSKGYALLEPLVLLDRLKIKQYLADDKINLEVFENISSTNDYLKALKKSNAVQVCLAEHQMQGRGRFSSREWYAPFGKNIYLSCRYAFNKDISELAGLSMVATLAVVKTLKEYDITDHLFVKWPNDVVYQNKKLSGSLIEIQAETHGLSYAIIGIGLNVNMLGADQRIGKMWTSMRKISNQYIDRNKLCARLLYHLLHDLNKFNSHGFSDFSHEWMEVDGLINQTITLKNVHSKIIGIVKGINEQGHLVMQLKDGSVRAYSSGDTSIMKKSTF